MSLTISSSLNANLYETNIYETDIDILDLNNLNPWEPVSPDPWSVYPYPTEIDWNSTSNDASETIKSQDNGSFYFQPVQAAHDGFNKTGGWWTSFDNFPRQVADVNGDGYADIVGFGSHAVHVALGQADGKFGPAFVAHDGFDVTGDGWIGFDNYPRLVADVNGDGCGDIIGFGSHSTYVALGNLDGTFGSAFVAHGNFNATGGSWSSFDEFPRQVADVNGDGRADIIGFGESAVYVALGQENGTFSQHFEAHGNFNATGGSWSSFDEFPRQVADVNGDGRADIIGFGESAVYVALGQENGTFSQHFVAHHDFNQMTGWESFNESPRQVADINGDGRADIIGFGDREVSVALGQSDGTFSAAEVVHDNFVSYNYGWSSFDEFPRRVADVNGDGQADIVGFGREYTYTALANPSEELIGNGGHDRLVGGAGFDVMTGDAQGSAPDIQNSNDGADTFVLGDATQAFYQGLGYATITDFNWSEGDKIEVHGSLGDYHLGMSENFGGSSALDTAIYYQGDLIGVVQDTHDVILDADFIFV